MLEEVPSLPPDLVWGVLPRAVALVYLISFASLRPQLLALAGARGVTPVARVLDRYRRDLPSPWFRGSRIPTLLWLSSSDRTLTSLPVVGAIAAATALVGGPWVTLPALLVCWAIYRTLDLPAELNYPWDCMLFELGFLALFIPEPGALGGLHASSSPLPIVVFALHALLFRVMFGFGKVKFIGATSHDRGYLREFLVSQPLPTRLARLAHHLPRAALVVSIWGLFVIEIIMPFAIFWPGWPRLIAAAAIGSLMVGIWMCGTFGYFNLVVLVGCIALLDPSGGLEALAWTQVTGSPSAIATHVAMAVVVCGGLVCVPFNSWSGRSWLYWTELATAPQAPLRWLHRFARALGAWRLAHAYGVFNPQGGPAIRFTTAFEGRWDGDPEWSAIPFRHYPTRPDDPLAPCAPHHPRLDQAMIYSGLGFDDSNVLGTVIGSGLPHAYSREPMLRRIAQRLLDPDSPVREALFAPSPFTTRAPDEVRVILYALEPTAWEDARAGRPWTRRRVRVLHPPTRSDPGVWRRWLSGPECYHVDHGWWRARSPLIAKLHACVDDGADVDALEACVVDALGVSPDTMRAFWEDFAPAIAPPDGARCFSAIPAIRRHLLEHFDEDALGEFERIAMTLRLALLRRYDDRLTGPAAQRIAFKSYAHAALALAHCLLDGRDALAAFMRRGEEPLASLNRLARAEEPDLVASLWLDVVFRFDAFDRHAAAMRQNQAFMPRAWSPGVPGFVDMSDLFASAVPRTREEALPAIARDIETGAWQVIEWELHPPSRAAREPHQSSASTLTTFNASGPHGAWTRT